MREFSLALNVRCEHCHIEGGPDVANRFKADDRPAKAQARAMMRMTRTINETLLTQLPSHATPPVPVDCVTCHHGLAIRILELEPASHGDFTVILRNEARLTLSRSWRERVEDALDDRCDGKC